MHGPTEIKSTALYERLSRDDELAGDSSSIQTQKALLEDYARQHGFVPFAHYTDDGWSGGNFDRPRWKDLVADIEAGRIGTVIVKDMSRVGREYLQTGYYTEVFFPQNEVRFIAVSNGIDSVDRGSGEIAPFINIMNDFYLRDCSRKMTQAYQVKGKSGKRITNIPIYGYKKDPADKTRWIVDEEAAPIVRRMFQLAANGYGPGKIATIFNKEKTEAPGYYMSSRGYNKIHKLDESKKYDWLASTVGSMLSKPEYLGHTVNFRSCKKHYKDKKRTFRAPEDWLIFENTHEAIIDEATWNTVQEIRKTKRRYNHYGEPNILTGLVYCPDCGKPMYEHRNCRPGKGGPCDDRYECSTYNRMIKRSKWLCTSHSISRQSLTEIVLDAIRLVGRYAIENPQEFRRKVQEQFSVQQQAEIREISQRLKRLSRRREEINTLIKKLYESYAFGMIPEEQFTRMMADYTKELSEVKEQITADEQAMATYREDADRADQFLAVAKQFTDFIELTGEMLNAYVERIYVHARDRSTGTCTQQIDIHFRFIGQFPVPIPEPTPEELAAAEKYRQLLLKQKEYRERYKAKKAAAAMKAAAG